MATESKGKEAATSSGSHSSLEGFMVVSKGIQGKQLEAIISNVLSKADIFIFGELLDLKNYQAVRCVVATLSGS